MMKRITLALLAPCLLVAAGPAPDTSTSAKRYAACTAEVRQNPQSAVTMAEQWRDIGGGAPAKHCLGLALFELGQAKNAAAAFAQAASDLESGKGNLGTAVRTDPAMVASLYSQAGNAALLAEDPAAAYQYFSRALTLAGNRAGDMRGNLYIDRARALAGMNDFARAKADLTKAIEDLPDAPEAWMLRAAAKRKTNDLAGASADATKAVSLAPDDPDALLERAAVHALSGDVASAKADWQAILAKAPDSPAAAVARSNLENAKAAAVGDAPASSQAAAQPQS